MLPAQHVSYGRDSFDWPSRPYLDALYSGQKAWSSISHENLHVSGLEESTPYDRSCGSKLGAFGFTINFDPRSGIGDPFSEEP